MMLMTIKIKIYNYVVEYMCAVCCTFSREKRCCVLNVVIVARRE